MKGFWNQQGKNSIKVVMLMQTMSIKVDKKLHKQVKEMAYKENISQAEVVRRSLKYFLHGTECKSQLTRTKKKVERDGK
jgi:predicted component of type VI protein secretion system